MVLTFFITIEQDTIKTTLKLRALYCSYPDHMAILVVVGKILKISTFRFKQ